MKSDPLRVATRIRRARAAFERVRSTKPSKSRIESLFDAIHEYDRLIGELYRIRRIYPETSELRVSLEDSAASLSHDLVTWRASSRTNGMYSDWLREYRAIWRREFSLFAVLVTLFLTSTVCGWNLGVYHQEYLPALLPQGALENVIEQRPWFDSIKESPVVDGIQIAVNNIQVAINSFVWSALLGIGGLYILCFNGVFLGALVGFCFAHGFEAQIGTFIAAHGPLELTIIIASAFSGLLFGRVFFLRPYRHFAQKIRVGGRQAGVVLLGILPWLVVAALFEVFVSPWDYLSPGGKVLVGLLAAAVFWIWTFGLGSQRAAQKGIDLKSS